MAAETAALPVNGSFVPHQAQPFTATEQGSGIQPNNHQAPAASITNEAGDAVQDISKEEVGWYFVEKYYTTLSKKPDSLYLFYNKRSQSVFGVEDEKAPVCVGQRTINERMKELDFQDCKIRVTNVDSQESESAIVIQVIGEISNKSAPHRKFVQTFVLARQTNGYFVLNDIFRYIAEEEEELVDQEETAAPAETTSSTVEPTSTEPSKELAALNFVDSAELTSVGKKVDEGLEEATQADKDDAHEDVPHVNGTSAPENAKATDAAEASIPTHDPAEQIVQTEQQPDKPSKTDSETLEGTATRTTKAPAASAKPAAPKTWASLAASANKATSPAATPTTSAPPQPSQKPVAQPAASTPTPGSTQPTPVQTREAPESESQPNDGWQAVGGGHDRKQSRAQGQVGNETPRFRAYIKNVYSSVESDALESELSKHGELSYFDISRQKNCAFVDFATQAGFEAAVAANPHQIGNDQIYVEERRERPFQFQARGGMRGGRGGSDGRPGQGRGGYTKENGRGGFQPRGRGGSLTPRGRGTSQAA